MGSRLDRVEETGLFPKGPRYLAEVWSIDRGPAPAPPDRIRSLSDIIAARAVETCRHLRRTPLGNQQENPSGDEPALPTVEVAIVNWNTAMASCTCAASALESAGVDVTVTIIDNDSALEDRAIFERELPDGVRLILGDDNPGFGTGANRALEGGESEYVCVSNPDIAPQVDTLAQLIGFLKRHPDAGVVGPRFLDESIYHAEFPKGASLPFRAFVGRIGHHPVASPPPGEYVEAGQPAGAFFVMRRSLWQQLGGFDEGFFLWYEDVDLAKRAQDAGFTNYLVGAAAVTHGEGISTGGLPSALHQEIRIRSLQRYAGKHHPWASRLGAPVMHLGRLVRTKLLSSPRRD